ncbi:hypothetical protein [Sporosarcina sp. G11-34]|nr:hypothetical protein [Sporosarcina sp. G11-34]
MFEVISEIVGKSGQVVIDGERAKKLSSIIGSYEGADSYGKRI